MKWAALILFLCTAFGCDAPTASPTPTSPRWRPAEAPPPPRLSETGLFAHLWTLTPRADAIPYEPPHALWSNGAEKHRFLWLSEDAKIDPTTAGGWTFPVGAVAVKTFTFDHVEGRGEAVPIETRLIIRGEEEWSYAVYHWNVEGTEARLLLDNWDEVPLRLRAVAGNEYPYAIPAQLDCRGCHETQPGAPIIGISPDNFDHTLSSAFTSTPEITAFPARNAAEAAVMGYLVGNCVHCHHGVPGPDNASYSLRPQDLVEATVNVPTDSSASGVGVRVVPGDAEGSALYEAVVEAGTADYPGDFKPMPPVGSIWTDPDVPALLTRWIESL